MLKILFSVQGQAIWLKNGAQSIRNSDKLAIASGGYITGSCFVYIEC